MGLLKDIHCSIDSLIDFSDFLKTTSKNEDITFLSLDPLRDHLKLFHHPTIIRGS